MKILIAVGIAFTLLLTLIYFDSFRMPIDDSSNLFEKTEKSFSKEKLDQISFKTASGLNFSLNSIKNKIVLINFWASFCPPCIIELPHIIEFIKKHPNDVELILVNIDRDVKDIDKTFKKLFRNFNVSDLNNVKIVHDLDKKISQDAFNIFRLPETLIINHNYYIVDKIIGHQDWISLKAQNRIEGLLKESYGREFSQKREGEN